MAEKPFIRVRNKATGHEYDVHEQALNEDRHEVVEGVPRSTTARPPKPVQPKPEADAEPEQASDAGVEQSGTAEIEQDAPPAPPTSARKSKPAASAAPAGE